MLDKRVQPEGELSDSEDEGEGGRRNHAEHKVAEAPLKPGSKELLAGPTSVGTFAPAGTAAANERATSPVEGITSNKYGKPQMAPAPPAEDVEMIDDIIPTYAASDAPLSAT